MSINDILKPKSRKQLFNDFRRKTEVDERDLKRFLTHMRRFPMAALWIISSFIWIFSLSWIVQSIIAISKHFFWFPIDPEIKSMFGFINIFWAITWFAIPIALIIFGVALLGRAYDNINSRY